MSYARLPSLDLLRGGAVALMILVNNPGSWSYLYGPLAHAPWHGMTPTDLVFPVFLFAVGNALAITLPPLLAAGPAAFARKWSWRVGLIFALGLLLNAAPGWQWTAAGELAMRDWGALRIMGVLQRIALAWGIAALLLAWCLGAAGTARQQARVLALSATMLIGYHLACQVLAAGPDPFSLEGFFGTHLDRALLGASHLYRGEGVPFDPEGIGSTLPAVAQVLLGAWAGQLLRPLPAGTAEGRVGLGGPALLAIGGVGMLALGAIWADLMPVNKKLWTSSYVLLSSGIAMLLLAALAASHDPRPGGRGPAMSGGWLSAAAGAFGRNALFIFVLSGLLPRLQSLLRIADGGTAEGGTRWLTPLAWTWRHVFEPLAEDRRIGSLAYALVHLALYAGLALWMDRRRLYVRI